MQRTIQSISLLTHKWEMIIRREMIIHKIVRGEPGAVGPEMKNNLLM